MDTWIFLKAINIHICLIQKLKTFLKLESFIQLIHLKLIALLFYTKINTTTLLFKLWKSDGYGKCSDDTMINENHSELFVINENFQKISFYATT